MKNLLGIKQEKARYDRLSKAWLPDPKIIITVLNKIIKAFEDTIQAELIKVRWKEIKRLQVQTISAV